MPTLVRPDGATVNYQVQGDGDITVLLLANGGMRSSIEMWKKSPYDPLKMLSSNKFRLVGMDQRMSKTGNLPSNHNVGWTTFRDDQMAVLDHLGVTKCQILASCIGPAFALQLLRDFPHRFHRAVFLQPIGLGRHTTEPNDEWEGLNHGAESHWFGDWAEEMEKDGRASKDALVQLHQNMFGGERSNYCCFTATRQEVSRIEHPLFVFPGIDIKHPAVVAREQIAALAPNVELIEEWRTGPPENMERASRKIEAFLEGTT